MRGFAVFAIVAILVGGCAPAADLSKERPALQAADPPPAILELRSTVPTADTGPYQVTITHNGEAITMILDETNRAAETRMTRPIPGTTATVTIHALTVGEQDWMKIKMPAALGRLMGLPDKWMLIDKSKMKDADDSTDAADSDLFATAAQVRTESAGKYTGVLDLVSDTNPFLTADEAAKLGAAGKSVPFKATTQDGHLTSVAVQIPKLGTRKVTLSGYGITTHLTAPAPADQTAMPKQAYTLINAGR